MVVSIHIHRIIAITNFQEFQITILLFESFLMMMIISISNYLDMIFQAFCDDIQILQGLVLLVDFLSNLKYKY